MLPKVTNEEGISSCLTFSFSFCMHNQCERERINFGVRKKRVIIKIHKNIHCTAIILVREGHQKQQQHQQKARNKVHKRAREQIIDIKQQFLQAIMEWILIVEVVDR